MCLKGHGILDPSQLDECDEGSLSKTGTWPKSDCDSQGMHEHAGQEVE